MTALQRTSASPQKPQEEDESDLQKAALERVSPTGAAPTRVQLSRLFAGAARALEPSVHKPSARAAAHH